MLKPLRTKATGKQQVAKTFTFPAPVKGWYVGAEMSNAPPGTAYVMNNAFPQLDYVRARGGCQAWATGMGSLYPITSLMPWTNGVQSKLFAVANHSIYDVSSSGAVGAPLVTGLGGSTLEYMQFSGTGGQFLMCANGVDPVQLWTGSAWATTPAITGLTGNQLSFLWAFKSRVYGIEANSLNAWYLPLDSIGGAATLFPMESLFTRGGYLIAGGTWAIQTVSGLLEACVFVTSEGEVAVFTGSYPGGTDWGQQGIYKMSKPLGNRCLMKAGGDLAIMTEDGIVSLSQIETLDQVALQNVAITVAIAPAWRDAVIARTGLTGWQITIWPLQSMAIVNLPKLNTTDKTQFVANARTGAWCQYLGWDANCFAVFNNQLFFGTSDGRVMQGEIGGQDDGNLYTWTIFPSYSDLGAGAARKHVTFCRPRIQSNFGVSPQVTVKIDFDITTPAAPGVVAVPSTGPQWGVAKWGVDTWGNPDVLYQNWVDAENIGSNVSPVVQVSVSTSVNPDLRLTSIDVLYEEGNIFG